jgi:hypothetical protein
MTDSVWSDRSRNRNRSGVLRPENGAGPGLAVIALADGRASDGVGAAAAAGTGQFPVSDEMASGSPKTWS